MHKPIKYAEKALTYVARGAWTVFDPVSGLGGRGGTWGAGNHLSPPDGGPCLGLPEPSGAR